MPDSPTSQASDLKGTHSRSSRSQPSRTCSGWSPSASSQPHRFDEAERQFLGVVAKQIAQALDRAQLSPVGVQDRRAGALLSEVSSVVAGSLDYLDTIRGAVRVVVPSFADMATVHLIDEWGGLVRAGSPTAIRAVESLLQDADELNVYERRGVLKAARLSDGERFSTPISGRMNRSSPTKSTVVLWTPWESARRSPCRLSRGPRRSGY